MCGHTHAILGHLAPWANHNFLAAFGRQISLVILAEIWIWNTSLPEKTNFYIIFAHWLYSNCFCDRWQHKKRPSFRSLSNNYLVGWTTFFRLTLTQSRLGNRDLSKHILPVFRLSTEGGTGGFQTRHLPLFFLLSVESLYFTYQFTGWKSVSFSIFTMSPDCLIINNPWL